MIKKDEKILIFGNGQMAGFYKEYFDSIKVDSVITNANVLSTEEITKAIEEYNPSVVINTAAKTNLEWCANNKLEAFNVNVLGANNIAQICDEKEIYFIHFSSGCIMGSKDENDIKSENSIPDPISYYSWTKVWAENLVMFKKSDKFKCLILRPRQPVSAKISYKNMLIKFLTFSKFIDTPNSGTVLEDLMVWSEKIIEQRITGILNVANKGWITPYNIGLLLRKHVLPSLPVNKIEKSELNTLTPEKRVDTVLDVTKLESIVGPVKEYSERLEEIIINLGQNFKTQDKAMIKTELEKTLEFTKTRTVPNEVWTELIQ
ncbi:MAG: sugar nucleotide-binding protein [Microgenomates group bacterium]